ncbi:hypothetical protein [Idiomarina sp. UBA3162]|uniref:hypothetical protein n=1 Tax=unclassified Idiomarina TaxID=2614829 RepID=UPI000C894317|nr:hypothetical protein [Idiomarina sp. UBA3162]MAD53610.1 hypothetical protein [Idiomarinaceae bacterium]MEC7642230.1 hypothetical protein [Pseudomonadota bacterium]MEC9319353.1 hypothetical protein [Pseudomonadota bacterium]|tara:strand:+ start:9209 stop:9628 length:420 start_codon:yes stop_codon:yes gene_type:complete
MAFREKSAWLMLIITLLVGGGLTFEVVQGFNSTSQWPPAVSVFTQLTMGLIVLSIIGQIALALVDRKSANRPADEREKTIQQRADAYSGILLGVLIVSSLMTYLVHQHGDLLFLMALLSLVVAQAAEYLVEIIGYRRGY